MCKTAANQLNSIKRLKKHFDMETKRHLTKNICPLSIQLLSTGMALLWKWRYPQNGKKYKKGH